MGQDTAKPVFSNIAFPDIRVTIDMRSERRFPSRWSGSRKCFGDQNGVEQGDGFLQPGGFGNGKSAARQWQVSMQ